VPAGVGIRRRRWERLEAQAVERVQDLGAASGADVRAERDVQLERAVGGAEADQVAGDLPALCWREVAPSQREVRGPWREGRAAIVRPDSADLRPVLHEVDQRAVRGEVVLGAIGAAVAAARGRV
jgi:hypothetical protein